MPVFEYQAVDGAGRPVAGTVTASGRGAAIEYIVQQNLHPVAVQEQRAARRAPGVRLFGAPVSQGNVDAFTRQLANLLTAGVPLSRALRVVAREATSAAARERWAAIHEDVVGGTALAEALAKYPRSFSPVYIAMVRAGETGGFLDVVLEQIADFRAWEQRLKGKVKSALLYPAVLAVLATAVLAFLLTYFIPRFATIFADLGGALPWLTRAIVAASEVMVRHAALIVIGLALVALAVRRAVTTEAGRRAVERFVVGLPLAGRVAARLALVRFCRMLGTLLAAGVPLVSALRVAREAVGNQTLADTISQAVEEVQRGASLSASLAAAKRLFPAEVVEMVAVAEESGRLDKELLRLATTYDGELDRQLSMLVALAEPALLFVMAAVVGTIVIGMLLPIFTLQELIR